MIQTIHGLVELAHSDAVQVLNKMLTMEMEKMLEMTELHREPAPKSFCFV
jgi:hypothetical protein